MWVGAVTLPKWGFHPSSEGRVVKEFRSEITKAVQDAKQLTVEVSELNPSVSSFHNNNGG
jgi:hypothetical protein